MLTIQSSFAHQNRIEVDTPVEVQRIKIKVPNVSFSRLSRLFNSLDLRSGLGSLQANLLTVVADLQSLAATASGYYPDHHQVAGQPMYYPNASGNSTGYHGGSAPQQGSAYGPVYYAVSQTPSEKAEYELRKRAAFDALNEFFGDAKRRSIDPATYYDVGQRLSSLQTLQLPMPGGFSSGGSGEFQSGVTSVASAQGPLLQPQYSLPLSNLRTKNDLLQIDQFLDQLQQTVYENSNQAAAAGVAQPGAHYVPTSVSYRSSNSPPHMSATSNPSSSHATAMAPITSTAAETPALTPASSVLSYQSAHSPSSVHSAHTIERSSVHSMYPTLPSVSAMSESNVYTTTSSAPPSGLATAFDGDGRRRHSGGYLQKPASNGSEDSDETPSPITSRPNSNVDAPSPAFKNVDPALRSPGAQSEDSDAYKSNEAWIENVRIIEALRQFIKEKIESGDYDQEDNESRGDPMEMDQDKEAQSLYPVLREVQGEV